MEPTYSVRTWDMDKEEYTPQEGLSLPWRGLTLWQLKLTLKELRAMGYGAYRIGNCIDGHSSDPSVLVERD